MTATHYEKEHYNIKVTLSLILGSESSFHFGDQKCLIYVIFIKAA